MTASASITNEAVLFSSSAFKRLKQRYHTLHGEIKDSDECDIRWASFGMCFLFEGTSKWLWWGILTKVTFSWLVIAVVAWDGTASIGMLPYSSHIIIPHCYCRGGVGRYCLYRDVTLQFSHYNSALLLPWWCGVVLPLLGCYLTVLTL